MNVTEQDLQAYVDDALDAASRHAVAEHLAAQPEEAARLAAYRAQNTELRALFGPVADEPIPERLVAFRAPPKRWRHAITAAWLLAGIGIGWATHELLNKRVERIASLPRQAAIAHVVYSPEVRHPVEVGADQQDHLVKWLSKRLGTELKAPLLSRQGYELVGGRLLAGGEGPVAQFMYQDGRGQRLTLYVSRVAGEGRGTAFRFSQEDRVSVFYWVDGAFGYALSGELPKSQLLDVATVVYKQLNP